ncbi:MAG TPA: acyl-CoA dehydrogenase [Streptosporangiaceae bacterium]|nr:acyl-CoA dehydrogenase [Streptosporangiaceae bacterium]
MPIALTAEQQAMAESVGQWAGRAGTIAAVRGLEASGGVIAGTARAKADWAALSELGVFSLALPAERGGGSVADVAVVTEQLAACLAPGPVLPTLLAALACAEDGALLDQIGSGEASVAVALSAGGLRAERTSRGALRVTGTSGLLLGAGDTSHLLLGAETDDGEAWFTLAADAEGVAVAARVPVDFSRALGDVTVGLEIQAAQVLAHVGSGRVRRLAAALAAAEASGVAAWCHRTAADYAKSRRQFGREIGSFQAVKHLCAGMLCRSAQAAAIAWDAARAADEGDSPLAAAAAAALALDAAVDNAKDAIQVLGGIGFTWEHDAHLYLRRALALRQLLGGGARWRAQAAGLAIAGVRRQRRAGGNALGMKASSRAEEVRKSARLVATAVSAVAPERRRRALAEVGYIAPGWPRPHGLGASPADLAIIDEELGKAGITRPELAIGNWAIPAIAAHGTAGQLRRFAEPTLRGDITWCQLFSEPEAGSDLASLRTRAVRDGDGWRLSGQKVWTSLAARADWAICLARTDPAAPKHKGITYFLVPMKSAGIEIRPLREMTGRQMFSEVFLDEVFVPGNCVVGQPGDGWRIARTTLATERVAMVGGLSEELEALLAAAARGGANSDPVAADQLGARLAEGLALAAMDDRANAGGSASPSVRKLLGVAHRQAIAETALAGCGPAGAAADGAAGAAVAEFLLTRCLSIAGGTTQILLNLVAERELGLPRDEAR